MKRVIQITPIVLLHTFGRKGEKLIRMEVKKEGWVDTLLLFFEQEQKAEAGK